MNDDGARDDDDVGDDGGHGEGDPLVEDDGGVGASGAGVTCTMGRLIRALAASMASDRVDGRTGTGLRPPRLDGRLDRTAAAEPRRSALAKVASRVGVIMRCSAGRTSAALRASLLTTAR